MEIVDIYIYVYMRRGFYVRGCGVYFPQTILGPRKALFERIVGLRQCPCLGFQEDKIVLGYRLNRCLRGEVPVQRFGRKPSNLKVGIPAILVPARFFVVPTKLLIPFPQNHNNLNPNLSPTKLKPNAAFKTQTQSNFGERNAELSRLNCGLLAAAGIMEI